MSTPPPGRYFQHALASDFWPRRGRNRNRFQLPQILRVQTFVPVRQLPLAHYALLRRQPTPVHTVIIAAIPLRFRQPLVQPQEGLPTAVAHLKVYAPPSRSTLPAASYRAALADKFTSRQRKSPAQCPTAGTASSPNPNSQGPPTLLTHAYVLPSLASKTRLMAAMAHAFAVQIDGLFLDLFRAVVAIAVGSEAVVAKAAAAGLLAPGASVFGQLVGTAVRRWSSSR